MADAVIELETGPPAPEQRRPIPKRWLLLSLAGLLVVAAVAYAVGQAQRPKPPPPRTYVSSPGFSIYVGDTGDSVFIIAVHNYGPNPITISKPAVTTLPGTTDVRLSLSATEPMPDYTTAALNWPATPGQVSVPAFGEAHLAVGYHVGCPLVGQRGPFVLKASVLAAAGSVRSIRNVTPELNPDATYGKPYCPMG
jgi:hypothetical protein